MSSADQNKIVEISHKIMSWLVSFAQTTEDNTPRLLDIFLLGETLQESLAYVIQYQNMVYNDGFVTLECRKYLKPKKNIIEILLPPNSKALETAASILEKNLQIPNKDILTKELYLENPQKSLKERMTFILGE